MENILQQYGKYPRVRHIQVVQDFIHLRYYRIQHSDRVHPLHQLKKNPIPEQIPRGKNVHPDLD